MHPQITLSSAAAEYIKKILAKNSGLGLRLSVKKTGCSGFSYAPTVVNSIDAKDILVEIDGIKIFIDPTWHDWMQGITIDYLEDKESGLKQKKLVFNNPKEASRCGCGQSFHLE